MSVSEWLDNFGAPIVDSGSMSLSAAAVVKYVERYATSVCKLVELRCNSDYELVVLDFRTGRPQHPCYSIRWTERVAIVFNKRDAMPIVYVLRDDFPDTEHQNITNESSPRAICIDNRSWEDARLTWTASELIDRILSWFYRVARGELHDIGQPLDPLINWSRFNFVISRKILNSADEFDLIGVFDSSHPCTLRVIPLKKIQNGNYSLENSFPITVIAYTTHPQKMQRLKFAPNNLGNLKNLLSSLEIDLLDDLKKRITDLLFGQNSADWRFRSQLVLIVEMPIVAPNDTKHRGTDLRAFLISRSIGDIAVVLGVAIPADSNEGSETGFVKAVIPEPVKHDEIQEIHIEPAEVHYEFDKQMATEIVGRSSVDEREVVLVGAGAIGSNVADCLNREGKFHWTVIDHDQILPHNLARHIARSGDIGVAKSAVVASKLSATFEVNNIIATPICANVLATGKILPSKVKTAFDKAEIIIDATASIAAERFISDYDATARRASIFFNPAGNAVVLLVEPINRSLTLRELEAQYLNLVAFDSTLVDHLAPPASTYTYTGACRAISNNIPQSRVMTLSGLVANGLANAIDQRDAVIKIWSLSEFGVVEVNEPTVAGIEKFEAGEWVIFIDQGLIQRIGNMRSECLPKETGGVLTGVVDIPSKCIHLIDAAPAPTDSKMSTHSFERGTVGVQEYLSQVSNRTDNQIRYIGEWHSHPTHFSDTPSRTDLCQIDWLGSVLEMDKLPTLMLIASDERVRIIFANQCAERIEKTFNSKAKRKPESWI